MQTYKELIVWQKSIELVAEIYKITAMFPTEEIYGLTNQMRRAAVALPSNLAEGYTRRHIKEYAQFARIAFASGAELETQIMIAKKLNFAPDKNFEKADGLLSEVMKMLNKLISALVARN